jgi:RpiR family transcriptional regulator, repressor of rpiB and als operon
VQSFDERPTACCIRERLPTLTALEARVISAIAGQGTMDENTLLKVVATDAGVSAAMVIKVAKKLGFDGFRSLRATLAQRNRLSLAKAHEELSGRPSAGALAERVCQVSVQALQDTFAALSAEGLERAARSVCAARQRDFYGAGGSAQVARDAAFKFLRIGIRASAFEDGCMMLMSAALLQKGDVAVAFSYSGQTLVVVEAVRQARKNGAHTIAVTNHADSLLAKEADLALCARAEDSPLNGERDSPLSWEAAASRLAQLGLVDALFMAVAKTNPAVTETGLRRTMSAVRTQRAPW